MSGMRAQGRPRRGAAEVGRDRIVRNLRNAIRSGVDVDLSRKTLSEQAGVTPALISYYFPDKNALLEEVAGPIVQTYRIEVESVLESEADDDAKLQQLVAILVRLYTKDGQTLDIYTSLARKGPASQLCEVEKMTKMLGDFFLARCGPQADNRFDATVLQGAIWGMCRFAARVEAEGVNPPSDLSPLVSRVARIVVASLSTMQVPTMMA